MNLHNKEVDVINNILICYAFPYLSKRINEEFDSIKTSINEAVNLFTIHFVASFTGKGGNFDIKNAAHT